MPILLRPLDQRSHLPTRLADLGRTRKTAIVAAGVFVLFAAVLAAVATACLLDAAYHLPAVVRAAVLLVTAVGGGAIFLRSVWKPMVEPSGAGHVAHLLEEQNPKLNDSLASAVEFVSTAENPHTSARFRRIAVVRAQRTLEKCDTSRLIPSGRAWRTFAAAAAVTAGAAALGFTDPELARHSLVRFVDPFGAHPWPTKTHVHLTTPNPADFPVRAAIGDPFDLAFTLTGVLPEFAAVAVQLENGNAYEEIVPVTETNSNGVRAELTARLEPHRIPRSFRFQVRANDAVSPWFAVTLAPPPKLVPLDGRQSPLIHATFPAYTDVPAGDLPDGSGVVEAVHGTRLRLRAATDRPVVSAVLMPQLSRAAFHDATVAVAGQNPFALVGASQLAADLIADIPVSVIDGTRLEAEFTPTLPGLYALRFTDETGLTGSRLLDFRISPDPAPVVVLETPAVGKDPQVLLPSAAVNVRATSEDRTFAVKRLVIEYRVGGPDTPLREIPLVDLPEFGQPLNGLVGVAAGFSHAKQSAVTAVTSLPVAMFKTPAGTPPTDGDRITLRAAASDYDDVSVLKEPGRSREEVTILVASPNTLDTILQTELSKLRPQLLKVREQQRQARERTEEVARAATDGAMTPEQSAALGQAERDQRAVRNDVTDPRDGVQQSVQLLKDTIKANGMPRSASAERVDAVAADLSRLAEQNLDPVEPLLGSARQEADKAATGGKPDPKKVADDLKRAVRQQQAAEANLDEMLKRLEQWGGAGEVRAEARALKEQLKKTGELGAEAAGKVEPGKRADKLTPGEQADLSRVADKFGQLADRAGATLSKTERLAAEKDARANELSDQAKAKAAEADAAADAADKQPAGSNAADSGQAAANKLRAEADAMKADAAKAKAEADALRDAVANSGGQDLVNDLRAAGSELQKNNPAQSSSAQKSAAARLDKLAQSLAEKSPEAAEQLRKKKELADEIDKLAEEQDELRKKVKQAEQIEDPEKRQEELKKLAREQDQLREKTERAAEKLTREREPDAADTLRAAADKMDAAKSELDEGKVPGEQQQEALDRLNESVKQLDDQREQDQDKLAREKRAELANQLKAVRERLKATDDEAGRIQQGVLKQGGWDRGLIASLGDLEDRAKAVADEIRGFAGKELDPLPVFKRLADQAATLTDAAAKRFAERKTDALDAASQPFDPKAEEAADDRTRRPIRTALRRLDHVLDSLKDDPKPKPMDGGDQPMGGGGGDMPPMGGGGGDQPSGVPQLAQLKALRGIQAELNDRTKEFATAHPDAAKLSDADREELDELERSQREVAELIEAMKAAFEKPMEAKQP
jgi:hypothetical protein